MGVNISMNYKHTKTKLQQINKHYNSFNFGYQLLILIHPISNAIKVGFGVPTITAVRSGKSGSKIKINEKKTTFTATAVKVGKSCVKVGKSCEIWSSHQTKMNDWSSHQTKMND